MAAKLRTRVPVLVAVAGLFVTPFCCLAEERTPSADDAVLWSAKTGSDVSLARVTGTHTASVGDHRRVVLRKYSILAGLSPRRGFRRPVA